jgi:hypothetical protein
MKGENLSFLFVIGVCGSVLLYFVALMIRDRLKSNKINELEYKDEKQDVEKNFYFLGRSDRIDEFNRLTSQRKEKRDKGKVDKS